MMNLYGEYLRENRFTDIIHDEYGFMTYAMQGDDCFIEDAFVLKEHRRKGHLYKMADQIKALAIAKEKKFLTATVNLRALDPSASLMAILKYGFKVKSANNNIIFLEMGI